MKNILIIGYVWVEPNSSAAGSRMLQLIHFFLQQNYQITFASAAQKGKKAIDLKALGVLEKKIVLNASSFDDFIKELNPALVLFDRFMIEEQFGWRIADHCPRALRILDTEDLHSLRNARQQALKKGLEFVVEDLLHSELAKREIAAIYRCDLSLVISSFEMELLQTTFQINSTLLLHLPFMLSGIHTKDILSWKPFKERSHFVTVGNFLHAPNVDAVLQLKNVFWPLIRKKIPSAELHIYGAYPTQQILEQHSKREGFLIKGFIQSAEEVVSNAKVVLAPLRFGAGIKGKLTEAMRCGTPSVTSSIGAEGMHANLPWNGCVTNDVAEFVRSATQLYTDDTLWKTAQNNGIEIINQLYNREQLSVLFQSRISNVKATLKQHRAANFIGSLLQYKTLRSAKYMSMWIEEKNKGK